MNRDCLFPEPSQLVRSTRLSLRSEWLGRCRLAVANQAVPDLQQAIADIPNYWKTSNSETLQIRAAARLQAEMALHLLDRPGSEHPALEAEWVTRKIQEQRQQSDFTEVFVEGDLIDLARKLSGQDKPVLLPKDWKRSASETIRNFTVGRERLPCAFRHPEFCPILFVEARKDKGLVGRLKMKLRPHGTGRLVPDPCHWLIPRDKEWREAEKNAIAALRSLDLLPKNADFDLVWSLQVEGYDYIPNLSGASGGATFALSGAILLGKDDPWTSMRKLAGYAVTAQIGTDGSLGSVDDVPVKLVGAARNSGLPLITTVGLCEDDWEKLRGENENDNWTGLAPKKTMLDS